MKTKNTTNTEITTADILKAIENLCRSERGRETLSDMYHLLQGGGISLDSQNKQAVMLLFFAAFTAYPQTVMDAIQDEINYRANLAKQTEREVA